MYGFEEYRARECPFPIVRQRSGAPDADVRAEPCGAPVGVVRAQSSILLGRGETDDGDETWTIECSNGHVLLFAESTEGDEPIGFDPLLVARTLNRIAPFEIERAAGAGARIAI